MTALFALELAPNITVNAIAPGVMLPLAGHEDADLQDLAENASLSSASAALKSLQRMCFTSCTRIL